MNHRQIDLSKLIQPADIQPLLDKFAQNKYVLDESKLFEIARNNAYSNHWKDLIYDHIQSKSNNTHTKDNTPLIITSSAEVSRVDEHTDEKTKPVRKPRRRKS